MRALRICLGTTCYRSHENAKKRSYDQRIREVEHGSFTPLVLSCTGGMGRAAINTYKRLATLISTKRDDIYSNTMGWIRCRLSFSRSATCSYHEHQGRPFHHWPCNQRTGGPNRSYHHPGLPHPCIGLITRHPDLLSHFSYYLLLLSTSLYFSC